MRNQHIAIGPLMYRPSVAQFAVGGVSIISLAALVLSTSAMMREALRLDAVSRGYHDVLRKPLLKMVFGSDLDLPWTDPVFDGVLLWLSLFAIINYFVYRHEGLLLWGHIRKNYCGRVVTHASPACTGIKWLFAFIATPWACLRIATTAIGSKRTVFTSCYVTLAPDDMYSYLKAVGYGVAGLIALAAIARRVLGA